jgi:hypothetical protein
MKLFAPNNPDVAEITFHGVFTMVLTCGIIETLDYFCTISVFTLD